MGLGMELQRLSQDMFRLSFGKELYLAIATAIKDESIGNDVPYANGDRQGWIVRGQEIFPWRHRPLCINETVHIIGPYLQGTTLAERLERGNISLGHISRLTRTLKTLKQRGMRLDAIHTQAIIFLEDGGVLFLANETVSLLCDHQGQHEYAWNYQPFNHPRSKKYGHSSEERYSFALAALTYFALCGKRPWDIEDNDELRQHIMSGVLPNLHFYDPYIRPEIVTDLQAILGQPKLQPPPLEFWENFFRTHLIQGTHTDLSANEVRMRTRRAHIFLNHLRQRKVRKRRLKLNSFRLFSVMLFLLVVGLVPYILTQLAIERPTYLQLSATDVVRTYYDGVERLDRVQVIETLIPHYAPPAIEQVKNIYRTSRVGMIFRFQNPYLQPESWIASGKERLGGRYAIYGIDNLLLTELERSEKTVRIAATYRYWLPLQFATNNPQVISGNSAVSFHREEIVLKERGGRWMIAEIKSRGE